MKFFNLFKKKDREVLKLACFDLDDTLCAMGPIQAETEALIAQMMHTDLHALHLRTKEHHAKTAHSIKSNSALEESKPTLTTILRTFNDVKRSHIHRDRDPILFSRQIWYKETLRQLNIKLSLTKLKELSVKYEKAYWDYLIPRLKLFPHTLETLRELKNQGMTLVCLTDSDGEKGIKLRRMAYLGLDAYFDFIITADDTKKNKPAIENWEYVLQHTGMRAAECMMVGDHPEIDLIMAKHCGFTTVWTKEYLHSSEHFNYVDHEITDIKDVLKIVKKYQ